MKYNRTEKQKRKDNLNHVWEYGRGQGKGPGIPRSYLRYSCTKPDRRCGKEYCYECLNGNDSDYLYSRALISPYRNYKWYWI